MTTKKNPFGVLDLDDDAQLGELDLKAVPVKIGGHVYHVRRDMSAAETRRYWELAAAKDDAGCLGILLGDVQLGVQLNTAFDAMPQVRMMAILRRIMITAGILQDSGEPAGEAGAS